MKKVLITGASGNVGSEIIKLLKEAGYPLKAAVRDIAKEKEILGDVESVVYDFEKPETFREAYQNVDKLFLMRPPAISDIGKYIHPAIIAARESGVKHIVVLSLLGAGHNSMVPHHKMEKFVEQSGVPYTHLRPSFFMQNLNTTHLQDLKENDEIFVPAGKGKTSFIDVRDIAAVAAKVIMENSHENKAYELTGSEALNYYECADIFTEVLGRKITYSNPSIFRFRNRMRKRGYQNTFIWVMIAIYLVARFGKAGTITQEVERLLGRKPINFRQYATDYKSVWQK